MELYVQKVSAKGKVSYEQYKEQPLVVDMDNKQVLTLAATIATCCLIGLEQHLPAHAALARKVKELEKSITALAHLSGKELSPEMVDIGTGAWGAAMKHVAARMN